MSTATAQEYDYSAGALDGRGATGGPVSLGSSTMPAFFVGIDDPLGYRRNKIVGNILATVTGGEFNLKGSLCNSGTYS